MDHKITLLIHNIFFPTLNLLIINNHIEEYNSYISLLKKYKLYRYIEPQIIYNK